MAVQQHLGYPDTSDKPGKKLESVMIGLGRTLDKKYQDYKAQRRTKEAEWTEAVRQYEGEWHESDLTKIEQALNISGSSSDPISVNITRPKTNVAIARMKDIQFPTGGDFNFFLKPAPLTQAMKDALEVDAPDPEMEFAAAQAGVAPQEAPTPKMAAESAIEQNEVGAPKMERQLRNRLVEARYGTKARLAIEDLCIKGTAVIKGPTIQNKKRNSYTDGVTVDGRKIQVLEERWLPVPSVERVDPIHFYPDPSARQPEEIEDAIEDHPMSASELVALSKNPAFMPEQIKKVLLEDPDVSEVPEIVQDTTNTRGQTKKSRYYVHEYHGPLDKTVLHEAGMISDKDFENPLKQVTGEIWFVDKCIIRMSLSHIEGAEGLPYSVTSWEKDPDSVFGHGVPYLLRNAQRTVNNAYLMLLDNASLTSGPQVVLNKEMIKPASMDENYAITPMKPWFMTEWGADVREAIQFVDIPAQMQPISQIIDSAMQFADIESATPLLQQGDMPSGNNTTTGLAMIASATNIIQKAASMQWDDNITKPLVERWYHFEMQYGEDDTVKGDYDIEVGGATERIEAEIRSQEIERMLGLAGSNEEFMMQVDSNKAFRALVDNTRTGDILRTQAEVDQMMQEQQAAAQQQQQQDPEMLKAQAAMMTAQANAEKAAAQAQLDNAKQQTAALEAQARHQSMIAEAQARNNEAAMNYQLGMARLAAERETTVAKLHTDLQLQNMEGQMKLELAEIDWAKFQAEVDVKEEFGEGI
jgi:hypothetical protein